MQVLVTFLEEKECVAKQTSNVSS